MNFVKIKLLIIAVIMFAASSAFASLSYDVTVDTSSLTGSAGYLYLQYNTDPLSTGTSTALVQAFTTDGTLGAQAAGAYAGSGTYVTGTLPGTVTFVNGNQPTNDYNHAITFGNAFNFYLVLPTGTTQNAGSAFSLSLFSDALGANPLKTADGTLFSVNLNADGTATTLIADGNTQATPTPIPAAAWLFGSGLMGLFGVRRRKE